MKKVIAMCGVLAICAVAAFATVAAGAPPIGQLCNAGDSTKINTSGDPLTVELKAPEGKVITSYCVKAGSVQNGGGAVNFYAPADFAEGQNSIVVSYPGGKAISHYSFTWEDGKTPCDPKVDPKCQPGA